MKTSLIIFIFTFLIWFDPAFAAPSSGTVIGWGDNTTGQVTGVPRLYPFNNTTGLVVVAGHVFSNAIAVSVQDGSCSALRDDGSIIGWGDDYGVRVLGNDDYIKIAGGLSLALKRDGTVVFFGKNTAPTNLNNVVSIASKGFYNLALKRDGTVVGWGSSTWQPPVPDGLSNVTAIAVGGGDNMIRHLALKKDGTVVNWGGETTYVDATPPASLSNVVAIAAGYNHSLALTKDGMVTGWGFNTSGQATGLPSPQGQYVSSGLVKLNGQVLSDVVAIAADREYSMALKKDGTVVLWGAKRFYRDVPAGLTNVTAIAAGHGFCLAITTNTSFLEKNK